MKYLHDGPTGFKIEGSLPAGTRWVTIYIAGRNLGVKVVRRVKEAQELLEKAFRTGHAPQEYYQLVPADAPSAMSEESKEKLRKLAAEKKAIKESR